MRGSREARLGALACWFALGTGPGCVGEDAAPPASTAPDAGDGTAGDDERDGGPAATSGAFGLGVAATKLTLTQRRTTRIGVAIERKGYDGPLTVTVKGTPAGISSRTASVPAGEGQANVDLVVEPTSRQGDLASLILSASDPSGKLTATLPLSAFVRGAPGDLDTTYGTNGVVTLPSAANGVETDIDPAGRVHYTDGATVKRLTADGALDATFGAGGTATLNAAGTVLGAMRTANPPCT